MKEWFSNKTNELQFLQREVRELNATLHWIALERSFSIGRFRFFGRGLKINTIYQLITWRSKAKIISEILTKPDLHVMIQNKSNSMAMHPSLPEIAVNVRCNFKE